MQTQPIAWGMIGEATGEGQRVLKENIMGSTTGRHESVEFMGPETVSRRNFLERI